jgi:hypothetical protein
MNIAIVVKNSNAEWEVAEIYNFPTELFDIFMQKYESGSTITGMVTGEHAYQAGKGAIWDGVSFSGGDAPIGIAHTEMFDSFKTYVILADNIVLVTFSAQNNSILQQKLDAVFASETTAVPILPGQIAKIGYIWNGTDFLGGN